MEIENQEQEILMENEPFLVGGGAVDSVNGMTGDVVLTTSDLENTSDYQTGTEVAEAINTAVSDEADIRQNADNNLQSQIDGITASSDVTDIVGTYAELENYDTSTLSDNDIIKVLQDETHQDETTYYRWNSTTQEFTLIGEEGPYYTKAQTDVLLQDKQDTLTAGNNITIDNDNVISATDTTYSDFVGTDGTAVGTAGLVPAPAIADVDKFLKSDGTWEEVGGGITELTSADYNWPTSNPDGAAMWLLPDGIYKDVSVGGIVYPDAGASTNLFQMFIKYSTSTDSIMVYYDPAVHRWKYWQTKTDTGARVGTGTITPKVVQTTGQSITDVMSQKAVTDALASAGGGPTVVQTTGTSTTNVMSQNAVTSMIFADPGTNDKIVIGNGASVSVQNYNMAIGTNASSDGAQSTAIGYGAKARVGGVALGQNARAGTTSSQASTVAIGVDSYGGGNHCVAVGVSTNTIDSYSTAIGSSARARSERSVAIGASAQVNNSPAMAYSVALGANAVTTRAGEVNIGTGANNFGYNNTNYRVLGGVHDGQLPQDVATVSQINATIDAINTALSTSIPHIGASS